MPTNACNEIDLKNFITFVKSKQGQVILTRSRNKGFTVDVTDKGFEFTPTATMKRRSHKLKTIKHAVERFCNSGSYVTSDYTDITRNSSYTLTLIGLYLDQNINSKSKGEVIAKIKKKGRELSKHEIKEKLIDKYGFTVQKRNRSEGGGIVASKKGNTYNIKCSYSRSYFDFIEEDVMCSGWHTLSEIEIENNIFQFFIFVVEGIENHLHYFIFKREDILKMREYKNYDSKKRLHFYFRVKKDGRPVEERETEKDMSVFYNNWDRFFMTDAATPESADISEPTIPERALVAIYRILRDTAIARRIKIDEDYVCQLCGDRITLGNGQPYAEAHHVKPLGKPHEGPDITDNILCVCPNCHVKLDYGAVRLSVHTTSKIRNEFIDYHNQHIFSE